MLSEQFLNALPFTSIDRITPVSGGDINEAYAIISGSKTFFLKVHPHIEGNFFTLEEIGLRLLGRAARTPHVIKRGESGDSDFLILEWIPAGRTRNERQLGEDLARVHRITSGAFGFDLRDVVDTRPQYHHRENNWITFYLKRQVEPQIANAKRRGHWSLRREKLYEGFAERFTEFYKDREVVPSLLHGDLWGGNVMYAENGSPVLIDPAVYYGNREQDIAMTLLFGGFGPEFYRSYNDHYPLEPDWQKRMPWYQLYNLLRHLNLFGEGYGHAVERAMMENGMR